MSSLKALMLMTLACAGSGCASSYQVVEVPQREADLYPYSQTRNGLTVAVDEIASSDRAARYFGADLVRMGVVPVVVVISNNGVGHIDLKPSDVLVRQGTQIIDPLPVETVVAMVKSQRGYLSRRTQKEIAGYFDGLVFQNRVLTPAETCQGVLFFPIIPRPRNSDSLFSAMSLFHESGLQVLVGARDLDTGSRMRFGPFPLVIPQQAPE